MDIRIGDLIDCIDKYILIDVRSEKEYNEGTIRDAINLSILDNEARHIVGSLYKQNKDLAYETGFKYGLEQLPIIYKEIKKLIRMNPSKEIVVFCARGGSRSSSVVDVLKLMNVNCYKLVGGYKEYRNYLLNNINNYIEKLNFLVISGNTGSGKTIVLNELAKKLPVIDLEDCANHRGSIFGEIGLKVNSQKKFEDKLFFLLKDFVVDNKRYVFIESESRKIGSVSLPNVLYKKILISPHILLDVSLEKRIEILSNVYRPEDIEVDKVKKIIENNKYFKLNMGDEWTRKMMKLLNESNFNDFIKYMVMDYYDVLYLKSQKKYDYDMIIKSDRLEIVVEKISDYYKKINV